MIKSKTGIHNSIIRQKLASPFAYRSMATSEARRIIAAVLDILEQDDTSACEKNSAALITLSLITGLTVTELSSIKLAPYLDGRYLDGRIGLFWYRDSDDCFLVHQSDIPRRDMSPSCSRKLLNCEKTGPALYPLPPEFSSYLPCNTFEDCQSDVEEKAKATLKRISKKLPRPLSLKMVQTFLENYMLMKNDSFADYLTLPSMKKENEAGLYYMQTHNKNIYASYKIFLKDLGLSAPSMPKESSFVGSALVPKSDAITSVFSQMFHHLKNSDFQSLAGFYKYHNWLAVYTGSMLRLTAGSRGELQTSISMSTLNMHDRLWHLFEKGQLRSIPMPVILSMQLNHYISYLKHIKKISAYQDPSLFRELEDILKPESTRPLVFSNESPYPYRSIFETSLDRHMGLGLKRNSLRHYVYTYLSQNLSEESLRHFIGHTRFYNESRAIESGQNAVQFETIRTATDKMFEDLKIIAFNPLARATNQATRAI